MNNLLTVAQNWLAQDPDTETRAELTDILNKAQAGDEQALAVLAQRFDGRLQFGTGGMRGPLQAGSMGMNRVLVAQAAKGLADYIVEQDKEPSIVIGYDGRKNSDVFARDTAEIMSAAGVKTILLPRTLPTPVLAFAIRYFQTTAGVMVTASHNPPQDNGYKVYLGKQYGGGQIVSPADKHIAAKIDAASQIAINTYPRSNQYQITDEAVIEQYVAQTAKLATTPACALNYVYTAMHGVGKEVLLKTLTKAGLPLPHLVAEQVEPDPTFHTVAFPNPEEKGALDLAIKLAKEKNAEFIIANDPDADRFAFAAPNEAGQWKTFHGNLIGCCLAWHIAKQAQQTGKQGALVSTVVSTPALADIAKQYGLRHEETLTGFKYIAKVPDIIYGFEESLGYLVDPEKVADKDGISAAIAFLDLVCLLKAQGKTVGQYVDELAQTFGAYASTQISLRVNQLADLGKLMQAFRQNPPSQIGAASVSGSKDYLQGSEPSEILVYYLDNGNRVIIRPSGTEPKVKVYLDVKGKDNVEAEQSLAVLEADVRALLRQDVYGKHEV